MRVATFVLVVAGWLAVLAGCVAPLAGMAWSLADVRAVGTQVVVIPSAGHLLAHSLTVAGVATGGALLAGLAPAALLGLAAAGRSRRWRFSLVGLLIAPLLVPPQVYAYAWSLATAPHMLLAAALPPVTGVSALGSAVRAGLISAGWLWPIVALVVGAGWRTTGRNVYALATLDASPAQAFIRAVLPSLRGHLVAAGCVVFLIALVEYPIPHLSLARTYATELLLLVDVGAPAGQIMRTALPGVAVAIVLLATAAYLVRTQFGGDEDERLASVPVRGSARGLSLLTAALWMASVLVPVGVLIASLRVSSAWREAFTLFGQAWADSIGVSLAAGGVTMAMAVGVVVWPAGGWRRRDGVVARFGAVAGLAGMLVPGAALGIGFVVIYNRAGVVGDLYTESPVVWVLALAARYAAIPVVIAALGLRRRVLATAEQARVDGAGRWAVLADVLMPVMARSLLAGAAIVALLSLSEVVVTQLVHPIAYSSIAASILQLMHYGRDDTVIVASLSIVAVGVILAQLCAALLLRRE